MGKRQIFLDTETTGIQISKGHRIVEIGAVEMIDRKLTGNNYHCLINPKRIMDDEVIRVHKISNEQLVDMPEFHEIAEDFINFISDSEVIIHNAPFDIAFIDSEFERIRGMLNFESYINSYIDTLAMAKRIRPGQQNSLDALCKHYGIALAERKHQGHGAILDSKLTAQVYICMTSGQTGFDFDASANIAIERSADAITIGQRQQLKVVKASNVELAEHNRVLNDIERALNKEGNALSLWRQIEGNQSNNANNNEVIQ